MNIAMKLRWLDPSQTSLKRSLALSGLAAIVGLGLAGYALFTAKGTSTLVVPPEDVALVNQQPVSRSDYEAAVRTLYGVTNILEVSLKDRQAVLDSLIREELFVQRGKELDVAAVDPGVRAAMVTAVEQSLVADAMAARPSEEALRDYYNAHKDAFSTDGFMTVRDLVFPSAKAAEAERALREGQPPERIVSSLSGRDTGRVNGEEFYFAAKIHLGDEDFAVARSLPDRGVAGPITRSDGVHLLYMVSNKPPVPMAFEAAMPRVVDEYRKAAMARVQSSDEVFLRKRANVLVAKDLSQ